MDTIYMLPRIRHLGVLDRVGNEGLSAVAGGDPPPVEIHLRWYTPHFLRRPGMVTFTFTLRHHMVHIHNL